MAVARFSRFNGNEWQADKLLFNAIQHSARVRMSLRAQARMPLNAINQQKSFPFSAFRFPFFANFANANG